MGSRRTNKDDKDCSQVYLHGSLLVGLHYTYGMFVTFQVFRFLFVVMLCSPKVSQIVVFCCILHN